MPPPEDQDTTIPVIDLSNPSAETAEQVLHAASTHGFLFIKNDGVTIPPADIDDMFKLSREFFNRPRDHKAEYAIHSAKAGGTNRGWVAMQGESLDPDGQKPGDPKEAFNISPPHPTQQPLPAPLAASAHLIARFQTACHTLSTQLLDQLAAALAVPDPAYFAARHDQSRGPSGSIFRMLYYPRTANTDAAPDAGIRAGAHSDYGSLTLLFRRPGEPGLELYTRDRGWVSVPVNPAPATLAHAPVLVNIGDLLSFWTAGLLKSTLHRVVFGGGDERYSMAYFCHPLDDARLERVPSRVLDAFGDQGAEELAAQRTRLGLGEGETGVLTAKEHLDRRLKVTYGL